VIRDGRDVEFEAKPARVIARFLNVMSTTVGK